MRDNLTHAVEDYLKTIYEVTVTSERASTKQIAALLQISPASVTGMLQKLANTNPPLVEYQKHRGVVLTADGEKVALEIVRHHRLLELYLHQMLGYEWDEVHAEADRLEHVISEDFEERIAQALGDPRHDPHGDPIPSRDLKMPKISSTTLLEMRPGQKAIIQRARDTDSNLLRHLSKLGLIPKTKIEIYDYSQFDKNVTLTVEGREDPIILGPQITKQIFVKVVK
jgi:DtxR family Mn-dependent transcriptional regulator